jgi:uncharacterized membrane protein
MKIFRLIVLLVLVIIVCSSTVCACVERPVKNKDCTKIKQECQKVVKKPCKNTAGTTATPSKSKAGAGTTSTGQTSSTQQPEGSPGTSSGQQGSTVFAPSLSIEQGNQQPTTGERDIVTSRTADPNTLKNWGPKNQYAKFKAWEKEQQAKLPSGGTLYNGTARVVRPVNNPLLRGINASNVSNINATDVRVALNIIPQDVVSGNKTFFNAEILANNSNVTIPRNASLKDLGLSNSRYEVREKIGNKLIAILPSEAGNATYTFSDPGAYRVEFNMQDKYGKNNSASVDINVIAPTPVIPASKEGMGLWSVIIAIILLLCIVGVGYWYHNKKCGEELEKGKKQEAEKENGQ